MLSMNEWRDLLEANGTDPQAQESMGAGTGSEPYKEKQ